MIHSQLYKIITQSGIQSINLSLIFLTLVISLSSYRMQMRASVREAIEQLDPYYVRYSYENKGYINCQIKAILDKFRLGRHTELVFKFNRYHQEQAGLVSESVKTIPLDNNEKNVDNPSTLRCRILNIESVSCVIEKESEIVVRCTSTNAVTCRRVASKVLDEIKNTELPTLSGGVP